MEYFRSKPELRTRGGSSVDCDFASEPQVTAALRLRDTTKEGRKIDVGLPATPLVTEHALILAAEDGTIRALAHDLKHQLWKKTFSSRFYASPILVPQTDLFVIASYAGDVHAIDLQGNVRWSRALSARVYGTPAVAAGRVYVPVAGHRLVGLHLQSGELEWTLGLPAPWYAHEALVGGKDPYSSVSLTDAGHAILAAGDHIVAVDQHGREMWRLQTGAAVRGTPALDYGTGSGIAVNVAGRLVQFSLADGSLQAEHRLGAKVLSSAALADGRAVIADEHGWLSAWDLKERANVWQTQVRAANGHAAISVLPRGAGFACLNERGNLVAVSAQGHFSWESQQSLDIPFQNTRIDTTPVITNQGRMYATSYSGFVYRFSFKRSSCEPS